MCDNGNWRGIDSIRLHERAPNNLAVIEQCTECGEYRAVAIDDVEIIETEETDESGGVWEVDR